MKMILITILGLAVIGCGDDTVAGSGGLGGGAGMAGTGGTGGSAGHAGTGGSGGSGGVGGMSGSGGSGGTGGSGGSGGSSAHVIQYVFVITMENHSASQIYGSSSAPYINGTLVPTYGHATAFQDPLPSLDSEPHYLYMEAGTNSFSDHTFGNDNDPSGTNSTASTAHIAGQIKSMGDAISWMSYQEDLSSSTGACPVHSSGNYAAKHDPFVFFQDIAGNPPAATNAYCSAHHKAYTTAGFAADLAAGSIGRYTFITPNLCNDMHTACSPTNDEIKQGDNWLAANLPQLITWVNAHQGVIFVVWDEDGTLPFLVIGPNVKQGHASSVTYDHGSLTKSVDEILGLPVLSTAASKNDFADFFNVGFFP
jgi:phosphatidylinositol-3-phosphatase